MLTILEDYLNTLLTIPMIYLSHAETYVWLQQCHALLLCWLDSVYQYTPRTRVYTHTHMRIDNMNTSAFKMAQQAAATAASQSALSAARAIQHALSKEDTAAVAAGSIWHSYYEAALAAAATGAPFAGWSAEVRSQLSKTEAQSPTARQYRSAGLAAFQISALRGIDEADVTDQPGFEFIDSDETPTLSVANKIARDTRALDRPDTPTNPLTESLERFRGAIKVAKLGGKVTAEKLPALSAIAERLDSITAVIGSEFAVIPEDAQVSEPRESVAA